MDLTKKLVIGLKQKQRIYELSTTTYPPQHIRKHKKLDATQDPFRCKMCYESNQRFRLS